MIERSPIAITTASIFCAALLGCGGTTFSGDSSRHDAGASGGSGNAGSASSGGAGAIVGSKASGGSAGTGGSPSSGGMQRSGGAQGSGGSKGSGGAAGTGGSAGCNSTTCSTFSGFTCCSDACVNTENDPHHCGSCDNPCPSGKPYCSGGQCSQPPCTPLPNAGVCAPSSICCGESCCAPGQICCSVSHNFSTIGCYDPAASAGTCPVGCPSCICASPDTPIATPEGDCAIASLRVGDRVLSVDNGRVVDVPILEVHRAPARHHHVVRVEMANGSVLEISAPHPTADGRTFGDLRTNDVLGGVRIERVTVVPYEPGFTYDILPASDSGTYYAGGVLIGSTLGGAALSSGERDYAAMSLQESAR